MNQIFKYSIRSGIFLYLLLFVFALIFHGDFSYMGVRNEGIESLIYNNFLWSIIYHQFLFLLVYILVGALSGLLLGYLFNELQHKMEFARFTWLTFFPLHLILFVVATCSQMTNYPQMYVEKFYFSPLKGLLEFSTNYFHPNVFFDIVLIIFIVSLILHLIRLPKIVGIFLILTGSVYFIIIPKTKADKIVIVLGMDSARWDKLTDSTIAPNFSRVIKQSTVFNNVWADVPRTFPSWTTLMTGQFAVEHGIRHMFPTKLDRYKYFPALPKNFVKAGYQTAVVSDFAGDIFSRINFGFQDVDVPYLNFETLINTKAATIHIPMFPFLLNRLGRTMFPELQEMANNPDPYLLNDEIFKKIDHAENNLFLTTFWSAAHFPYAPPYPWYKKFIDPKYEGTNKYQKMDLLIGSDTSKADNNALIALYNGGIASMDDAFSELVRGLKSRDLLDKTTFVILADHGEHLFETGKATGHGEHLRGDLVLRIPFFIWEPGKSKSELIHGLGSSADFAPTLLDYFKISPDSLHSGKSLLKPENYRSGTYAETGLWFTDKGDWFYQHQRILYPDVIGLCENDPNYNNEIVLKDQYRQITIVAKHRAWITNQYKLIYVPLEDTVKYELYNRELDPKEETNVSDQFPEIRDSLKTELFNWVKANEKKSFIYNDRIFTERSEIW